MSEEKNMEAKAAEQETEESGRPHDIVATGENEIKWTSDRKYIFTALKNALGKKIWRDIPVWICCVAVLLIAAVVYDFAAIRLPVTEDIEPMDVRFSDAGFLDDGVVEISGFSNLSEEELTACITVTPNISFAVVSLPNHSPTAAIHLENPRNTAYDITFEYGEEGDDDYHKREFTANGPALSVSIVRGGSNIEKNQPFVLEFNQAVDIQSLSDNLRIEPYAAYILQHSYDSNMQIEIIPDDGWDSSYYTATVMTGYTSESGKQLAEHRALSFYVAQKRAPTVELVSSNSYVLNNYRDMTLIFAAENLKNPIPVMVETYRMPDLEKYRDQGHIYLNYDVPLNHFEKLDTNAFLLIGGENRLTLPHFGAGGYIVSATFTDPDTGLERNERASYLITDLSVYMQTSNRETVIWLNSSSESGPLSGYQIAFEDGEVIGSPDAEGILIVPHGEDAKPLKDFSIFNPEGTLVYFDPPGLSPMSYHSERFYSYFFLDRSIYRPQDAVSFWGFVKPFRYNRQAVPESVTVCFDPEGLNMEIEAGIDANGTFSGEIPLDKIKSSQYSVTAEFLFPSEKEGDAPVRHVFESEYISVKEFEKPSYLLSSSVDKDYYGPNDKVTATVNATFYDGTPLPFFPIEVSYYDAGEYSWISLPDVTTDEKGSATFSFPAVNSGGDSLWFYGAESNQFMARIASDGENVTHMGSYDYFRSDVLLQTEIDRQSDGQNLALTVRSYRLDAGSPALRAEIASGKSIYNFDNERLLEIARGAPVDVDLKLSLQWDYYDNKNIRHRYSYYNDSWENSVFWTGGEYSLDYIMVQNPNVRIVENPNNEEKLVSLRTENGVATVSGLIYTDEGASINFARDAYFLARVFYKDGLDNGCEAYAYYPDADSYREDWSEDGKEEKPVPGYSFLVTDSKTGEDLTPKQAWNRSVTMGVGDTARFSLLLDGEPVETKGSIFYSIIHDGLYEYRVTDQNYIDINFKQDYIHSVKLVAAYFDGHGSREIKEIDLFADMSSMMLNIEVTPDKESYRPKDRVRLAIKATDSLGRGVAGNFCVAVVDESIFAISEQYIDVLGDLYGDIRDINNYVEKYFTAYRDEEQEEYPIDGGKGGDGAEFYDSYRSNFKDTALFYPARTDLSGNAAVEFDLPDNTTSWRITAVEVGHNMMGGQSKSNVISTLPFFVKPVISPKYIEGDDFSMLLQGHGALLSDGDEISYTVTVTGDGLNETLTAAGKAYQPVELNFGKLPIGSYTVVSRAQYDGYSDAVELPVSFIKSNLELVINKNIDITDTLDISAVRYPVTLTLYDEENSPYMASLSSMFGHYCMQTSQRMPRFVAKRALRNALPSESVPAYIQETSENLSDMQNTDGGIGAAIGAPSDPFLTAYVLLSARDQFNSNAMAGYFTDKLKTLSDPKARAACYLGLAAIGEVESGEILKLLESGGASLDLKAYCIAGLAYLGETETARRLYDEHLAGGVKRMNAALEDEDIAAAWIAATSLKHPDADAIALYFARNKWRINTLYECMIYVSSYSKVVQPLSFTYSLSGEARQVSLGYTGMHTLVLSRSELESFRFISYPAKLKAIAYYVGEPDEIGLEQSENMSIQKSVAALGQNTYEVSLTLSLTDDAPAGQYDISDWIPSSSRLYKVDEIASYGRKAGDTVYIAPRNEGQNLYFSVNLDPAENREITIRYQIRTVYSGEAVLDTAYVIHGDTGENCNTEKSVFKP